MLKYHFLRLRLFTQLHSVLPGFFQLENSQKLCIIFGGQCDTMEVDTRRKIMEISCVILSYMYRLRLAESRTPNHP